LYVSSRDWPCVYRFTDDTSVVFISLVGSRLIYIYIKKKIPFNKPVGFGWEACFAKEKHLSFQNICRSLNKNEKAPFKWYFDMFSSKL